MGGWLASDVALITGGGSGIGRAVALRFLDEGARVAVLDRDAAQLQEVVDAAGNLGERMLPLTGDVRSPDDLHRAVEATVERFGSLDVLVPNAGIWDHHRSLTGLSGKEMSAAFDEIFDVNVKGYALTVEAAWRELVRSQGNIVMTLSDASFHPDGGGALHTASTHACLGLLRQFAHELAPRVRVNGVAVGGMRTGLHEAGVEPEDFTGPYVLLASRTNSATVTGAVIPADGGIAQRGSRTPAGGGVL
ncbi:SDR family NAD(P)-dependent oxidoreductase [Streptomyces sp. NPDC087425]|uniref:SDR family NAD(P)-dependent oxidoreductase n=1 Tax=unclassified Streptomyces TaxID=2593676 RepID=UPI0038247797